MEFLFTQQFKPIQLLSLLSPLIITAIITSKNRLQCLLLAALASEREEP